MDALGAHSYDTLVELERESYYEKKFRRWLSSFSCDDQAFIRQLLGVATTLLYTSLDWHLLVITSCWDPVLRCVTIGDVDLVFTLEEYDRFLSLSTPLSTIFVPPVWPHYCKRLIDLLALKRPVVEVLTWYGSRI